MKFSHAPVFLFALLVVFSCVSCQHKSEKELRHDIFLAEQNNHFRDSEHSPLNEEDLKDFKSINYYPYDPAYCVEAQWRLTPDTEPFHMSTTTDRSPLYRKFGELHFELDARELVLEAYQSIELMEEDGFEDYLFVPFNDLTNGLTSYGGGRYIDIDIPDSNWVDFDFNNSYHPYCAYNYKYSCPIPPDPNVLDVAIEAGVRTGLNGEIDSLQEEEH